LRDPSKFSPSILVVKFGDPALATCSICNGSCDYDLRVEEPLSATFRGGCQVIWNVTRLEVWNIRPICYIFDSDIREYLNVIVYQPPETVSLSWEEPSGPLMEGGLYSLQCKVGAVAPAQKMTVAFYRGHKELGAHSSRTTQKTPVDESFSLNYTVSREDHGAHFWCEVRLELGPEGPQPPPVVRSQNVSANVLCESHAKCVQYFSPDFTLGNSHRVKGNPGPHYSWSVPSDSHTLFSGSVFTIHSASSQHEGLYSCNTSNSVGSLRRSFSLTVHGQSLFSLSISLCSSHPFQTLFFTFVDAPVRTSAAPVRTSAAPVRTSAAPVSTSAAPVRTSAAPVSTSAAPVVPVTPANKSAGDRSSQRLSVCVSLWLSLSCHLCYLHVLL
uniref:Ig-like domain-containing protein n=1 Tax=Neogobius melanostomus TaxID=47308 RepID=A0A8C6TB44_9GOBI